MKTIFHATITEYYGESESSFTLPIEAEGYSEARRIAEDIVKHWRPAGEWEEDTELWTDGEVWWELTGSIQIEARREWIYTSRTDGYYTDVHYAEREDK